MIFQNPDCKKNSSNDVGTDQRAAENNREPAEETFPSITTGVCGQVAHNADMRRVISFIVWPSL